MRPLSEPRTGAGRCTRRAMRCCMVVTALGASAAGHVSARRHRRPAPSPAAERPSIGITPENVRFRDYLSDLPGPRAVVGFVGGGSALAASQRWHRPRRTPRPAGNPARGGGERPRQPRRPHAPQHGLSLPFCNAADSARESQHALLETFHRSPRRRDPAPVGFPHRRDLRRGLRRPGLGARAQCGAATANRPPVSKLLGSLSTSAAS